MSEAKKFLSDKIGSPSVNVRWPTVISRPVHLSKSVKYLGLLLNEHLDWTKHVNSLVPKLNRAVGLLSKVRHYVPKSILKSVYFSLFNSHLIYGCQIWGQQQTTIQKLSQIQNKALRIINFKPFNYPVDELYADNKILKIKDYINLLNCMFVKNVLSKDCLSIFTNFFTKSEETHNYSTRHSNRNSVEVPQSRTTSYGTYSIKNQAGKLWNDIQTHITQDLISLSPNKCTKLLKNHFLATYIG